MSRFSLAGCLAAALFIAGTASADLTDDLVSYWPLDDSFVDVVGQNDGEFMGGDDAVFEPGQFGSGIVLDGIDQFVEITGDESNFDFIDQDFSISAWYRVDAFSKSWQALIAKGEGNRWRVHRRGDTDTMTWNGGNADVPEYFADDFGLEPADDGELHHFVGVSTEDAVLMYMDGQLVSEGPAPLVEDNDMPVMIGENPDATGRTWEGLIDDVAIWGRGLDEAEVSLLWNDGAGATPTGVIPEPKPFYIEGQDTIGRRTYNTDQSNNMFGPVEDGVAGWSSRIVTFDDHGLTLDSQTTAEEALDDNEGEKGFGAIAKVDMGGGGGTFPDTQPYPNGDTTGDDFVVEVTANVKIPAGEYTLGLGSDDGGQLTIAGVEFGLDGLNNDSFDDDQIRFEGTRGHGWTTGALSLDADLETTITASFFERGGGDSFEIAITEGDVLDEAPNTADWELLADGVLGWEITTSAAPLISADLSAEAKFSRDVEFDVNGDNGESDQIGIDNPNPDVFTTMLNIDGLTFQIKSSGDVTSGEAFTIVDADQIIGTPTIKSATEGQNWVFDASTGRVCLDSCPPIGDGVEGDFNNNGMRDVADLDLLADAMASGDTAFDLNGDGNVNFEDRRVWVEELSNTFIGDANFDGQFNSSDFVTVFGAAKYEKAGVAANWDEGDWNGDGFFNSSDFVAAFTGGGYEAGPRDGGLQTVPEPSSIALLLIGLLGLVNRRR
ncbi:LamG-like jellyroll fold domain-containing protein [Planctomycetota bacterium]